MFASTMEPGLLRLARMLGQMTLSDAMVMATGRDDWSAYERRAYWMQPGYVTAQTYHAVRAPTEWLNAELAACGEAIPADDHNYRRRYGATGGDREYWEDLMRRNAAQCLPLMKVSYGELDGRPYLAVSDTAGDAQYVNATLRDNGWPITTVVCSEDTAMALRKRWPLHDVVFQPAFTPEFLRIYHDLMVEALEILPMGTVIGRAIKCNDRPAMGMARPEDYPDGMIYPRGNRWSLDGQEMTTETLLSRRALPPAAVLVQVHYRVVLALMNRHQPEHGRPAEAVLASYRNRNGTFSYTA